jgi:hypothetical protein
VSSLAIFGAGWRHRSNVVDETRDGGQNASRDASGHEVPRHISQLATFAYCACECESPCARKKGKWERNEHWMDGVALDRGSASHAAESCKRHTAIRGGAVRLTTRVAHSRTLRTGSRQNCLRVFCGSVARGRCRSGRRESNQAGAPMRSRIALRVDEARDGGRLLT